MDYKIKFKDGNIVLQKQLAITTLKPNDPLFILLNEQLEKLERENKRLLEIKEAFYSKCSDKVNRRGKLYPRCQVYKCICSCRKSLKS